MVSYYCRPGIPATSETSKVRCRPLGNGKGEWRQGLGCGSQMSSLNRRNTSQALFYITVFLWASKNTEYQQATWNIFIAYRKMNKCKVWWEWLLRIFIDYSNFKGDKSIMQKILHCTSVWDNTGARPVPSFSQVITPWKILELLYCLYWVQLQKLKYNNNYI